MASRFFNKLKSGAQRLFSKVASDGPRLLGKISNTLGDAGTIVRKIENTGRDVLANPLVEAGASMALGPEAGAAMAGGSALLDKLGDAGKISKQASNLTNASTYKRGGCKACLKTFYNVQPILEIMPKHSNNRLFKVGGYVPLRPPFCLSFF